MRSSTLKNTSAVCQATGDITVDADFRIGADADEAVEYPDEKLYAEEY